MLDKSYYAKNVWKQCNTDTDSFLAHVKSEHVYKDLAEDIGQKFNTSNYEVQRPLLIEKKQKKSSG